MLRYSHGGRPLDSSENDIVNMTDEAAIVDHEGWNILGMMELKISLGPTGSTMKNESR